VWIYDTNRVIDILDIVVEKKEQSLAEVLLVDLKPLLFEIYVNKTYCSSVQRTMLSWEEFAQWQRFSPDFSWLSPLS
jgi:hypothetical protein